MFKKVNPSIVIDGNYAKWNLTTKAVYHVICCVANYKSGELHYSTRRLAEMAGVSVRSVRYATKRLAEEGIITKYERSGKTNIIVYHIPSTTAKDDPEPLQDTASPANNDILPLQTESPTPANNNTSPLQNTPETPATGCTHNKNVCNKSEDNKKTTTRSVFQDEFISGLISRYGKDEVMKRVAVVSVLDVGNKEGLLIDSLKRGYVPSVPRDVRRRIDERKRAERLDLMREQERLERKRYEEQLRRESEDPLVQARIKQEMDKIRAILGFESEAN